VTNNDFQIFNKPQYYAELIYRLEKTGQGDLIALASMNFESGDEGMPAIINALCSASQRGASVHLSVDAYNFLVNGKTKIVGPLWFKARIPNKLPQYYQRKMDALHKIQAAGGKTTITNLPAKAHSWPFGGRSHIKYAVINDYVYIGGCNLTASDDFDLMVGLRHATAASWLINFADKVDTAGSVRQALENKDLSFDLDTHTDLLIDAGVPNQSLIYEKALEVIDQADKFVFITCQLFPNSRTVRHLIAAHKRGAKVTIIYNHPIKHKLHFPVHQFITWREHARAPVSFFTNQLKLSQPYIHAKLIATENNTIIGSHNYVRAGVSYGTAEIALLRRDPAFALQAIQAIESQIHETGSKK
jgi:hypothetical protein